ncbi:MAG: serine/threonine protein kinase [Planctomyces sp.]|nr:serine/threonine protein kinase [Planctomyces sp.]
MSLDPQEVEELFEQGLKISAGPTRDAWLDSVCSGRSELHNRLSRLLNAALPTDDFLERPIVPVGSPAIMVGGFVVPSANSMPGIALDMLPERVGNYRILEILGRGGMGVVCRAEQTDPVHRQVALKLIRPGLDSDRIVARFEVERQSLAKMEHPNIARVLDVGATEDGRPWFAMELVSGKPITEYCDSNQLTTTERLALLIPVCQAVQHAHRKGVIHRDLKPGNILVANDSDGPVPKVIDFGVAKAIGSAASFDPLTTGAGVVGTMEYMSPEQAGLNQQDVDTRTDVYSLGIVMYELLTGSPPFSRSEFPDDNLYDILRRIREQEPTRPSEKLSTAESPVVLADRRRSDPRQLTRLLQGELDWIVLRALDKDREQRYSSVADLALDIERFLKGEIVAAAQPGRIYRLKKLWRRHRLAMIASTIVAVSCLAGLIGASWGMMTARASAEAERAARIREAEQRRYAESVANFLVEDVLALTTLEGQLRFDSQALTQNAQLQELLDRAALRLESRELDDTVAADLHWIIGVSQRASGNAGKAVPHLENSVALFTRSLGADHERTLNAKHSLGISLHQSGDLQRAKQLQTSTLNDLIRIRGVHDAQTLYAMQSLAETSMATDNAVEARSLLKSVVEGLRRITATDTESVLKAELSLALAIEQCGETEQAMTELRDIVERSESQLGAGHIVTLKSREDLAMSLFQDGQQEEALVILNEVVPELVKQLGTDHPTTLHGISNRAVVLQGAGRLSEALPMLRDVLQERRKIFAPDHPDLMSSELNFALALSDSGHAQEAVTLLESCLTRLSQKCGDRHPLTLLCVHNLGDAFIHTGQLDRACSVLNLAIQGRSERYGAEHPQTLSSLSLKARCLQRQGLQAEALQVLEQVLESRRRVQGNDSLDTVIAATNLAVSYRLSGRTDDAIKTAELAVEAGRTSFGDHHPVVISALNNLAVAYWQQKELDRSIPLFEEIVSQRTAIDPNHPDCLIACANLGVNYRDAGRLVEAVTLLRKADRRRFQASGLNWVHSELTSLCLSSGQGNLLPDFLLEDLQFCRSEYGDSSTMVANVVTEGALELLRSGDSGGASRLLNDSRTLFESQQLSEEYSFLFTILDGLSVYQSGNRDVASVKLTQAVDWLEVHSEKLTPSLKPTFQKTAEVVIQNLTSSAELQSRWKDCLSKLNDQKPAVQQN